jgi:carboxymethylenebutenolidase
MKSSVVTVFAGAVLLGVSAAQVTWADSEAPPDGRVVEFDGGSGKVQGYLATPAGAGPFPAVVVIQEWWGLTDWIRSNADRLASRGYVALAVDLYKGKVTDDAGTAHELMRALDQGEAIKDLKGGVANLRAQTNVDKNKPIGAIGWCMGGGYARELAQASDDVGPVVICYGSVTTDSDQIGKLKENPVLGIFGATDRGIPVARVQEFGKLLKDQGNRVEVKVYEGAGHGFMRPGGAQHNAQASDAAWKEIEAFFAEELGS